MKNFFSILLALGTLTAQGQTDVTKYFLENPNFETNYNYLAGETKVVSQELLAIDGWTSDLSANYTIAGVYEFGFAGQFNTASVPEKGYDGENGAGLAISTGWEQTFKFYQTVTLPAGTYTVTAPTYNGSSVTAATSLLSWIPNSGTAVSSSKKSFATEAWTLDQISFTLTATTTGKIQIGMKAAAGGSGNTAKLVIDYVKIMAENMAVDKAGLATALQEATRTYGDGGGNEAAKLKTAIDAAQGVYDNPDVDMIAVLEATAQLEKAVQDYKKENVSEENPQDCTAYITNPSFEKNGTEGWTSENLSAQSNSSFTKKAGSYYLEKWVGSGGAGNASVRQVIENLPNGRYKLTVAAQNYTQSSTSKKNTGAYIYANDQKTIVYTPNDYSVTFTNIAGEAEIGFVAENATGNWLAVDNFRLYLIGYIDESVVIEELSRLAETAKQLQTSMQSAATAQVLENAIGAAEKVIAGEAEYISRITLSLQEAIEATTKSIAEYQALEEKIASVITNYEEGKEGAEAFMAVIDEAKAMAKNAEVTSEALSAEIEKLDKAVLAFNLANATPGTGVAPKVTATNTYVPTGSTAALVRATMTGSNIVERGVCWSTERNPTVLDNRTTKSFSLRGYIFHIQGLEPATVYYVRPYVMNKTYTVAYGEEVKIVTLPKGTCTWSWDEGAPTADANTRCRNAVKETIDYFNEWTGIKGFHLSGHYGSGTPTADCSYGGWMRIGPNAAYQAIGTVLHETGHGVGVGTSDRWWDSTVHNWQWLGRETNEVYHFLENVYNNSDYVFVGDSQHGWGSNASYDWLVNGADKDKHEEFQYIGGMCILHGLFIDGLCPTGNDPNGISGYTYNFDDNKKYYLMNKNEERGLGEGLLYQRNATNTGWKPYLKNEEVSDSAAWYMEYNAQQGYYLFKNAMSGKYLTHKTGGTTVTLKTVAAGKSPANTEFFQLMPDRKDVTLTGNGKSITTHGYWFTWNDSGNKSIGANAYGNVTKYGAVPVVNFNYTDAATDQQWIIISEDELKDYQALVYEPKPAIPGDINGDRKITLADITALIDKYLTTEQGADFDSIYDVDGNGLLNVDDINALINTYLNLTSK